jgi:small subunit ribosomal protein S5
MAEETNAVVVEAKPEVAAAVSAAPAGARQGGGRFDQRGRGRGNNDRRRSPRPEKTAEEKANELTEKVVQVNRCAKVVKGGRRFSFSGLVVLGDRKGKLGIGFGKANEVADSIRKATDGAKKKFIKISLRDNTIPHEVIGRFGGAVILLRPAGPGTGLKAGGSMRAVLEAVGVKDVIGKSLGSGNQGNVAKATIEALKQLRTREEIYRLRGKTIKPAKTAEAKA